MAESLNNISPKSRLAAVLLCFFLGCFGAHRFYLRKTGTAVLMLITLGGLGIWALVDLIFILTGSFRDKEEKRVYRWLEPPPV
jgi:TM2 domain-containing membrane protein YozV